MVFNPTTWENAPSTATPITAEQLNRMEAGIVEGTRPASETQTGNVELASAAEMTAASDLIRVPSVKRVADFVTSAISGLSGGSGGGAAMPAFFNVKDPAYGAVGNGTTDDTIAVNAAITAANAVGGTVFFPPGIYSLNNIALKDNVKYEGIRGKSILRIRAGASYLASCDSGGPNVYVNNMKFTGLTFRGLVDTDTTFDQQRHLLNLNGVQDLLIWDCEFLAWHGDAIYLGSSNSAGVERHNRRVTIAFNLFDGITKNNRNCVSIIDGEDIVIDGNIGRRFSRNDMPGFVDVEPNAANGSFAVCRRISVTNNRTSDHNQNFFQLNLPSASYTNEIRDILVANNIDDAGAANTNTRFTFMAYVRTATDASSFSNIKFVNNICRNVYCIVEIEGGVNGVDFFGNTFEDCVGAAIIGYWNATTRHIRFENNTFSRCGQTDGNVFRLMYCNNISFVNNKWHSCVANLVLFGVGEGSVGTSTNIDWISNQVTGSGTTTISAKSASHALGAASNLRRPYRENGLTINTAHFGTLI